MKIKIPRDLFRKNFLSITRETKFRTAFDALSPFFFYALIIGTVIGHRFVIQDIVYQAYKLNGARARFRKIKRDSLIRYVKDVRAVVRFASAPP